MSFGASESAAAVAAACSVSKETGSFAPLDMPIPYPGTEVTSPDDIATAVFWDSVTSKCITDNQLMRACKADSSPVACKQIPSEYLSSGGWWSTQTAGGKATLVLGAVAGFGLLVYVMRGNR